MLVQVHFLYKSAQNSKWVHRIQSRNTRSRNFVTVIVFVSIDHLTRHRFSVFAAMSTNEISRDKHLRLLPNLRNAFLLVGYQVHYHIRLARIIESMCFPFRKPMSNDYFNLTFQSLRPSSLMPVKPLALDWNLSKLVSFYPTFVITTHVSIRSGFPRDKGRMSQIAPGHIPPHAYAMMDGIKIFIAPFDTFTGLVFGNALETS